MYQLNEAAQWNIYVLHNYGVLVGFLFFVIAGVMLIRNCNRPGWMPVLWYVLWSVAGAVAITCSEQPYYFYHLWGALS